MLRPVDSSNLERVGVDLRKEIRATGEQICAELRQEIRKSAAETRLQMEQFESRILASVDASAAETRRYISIVAGGLKSDIKAVAEGLGDGLDVGLETPGDNADVTTGLGGACIDARENSRLELLHLEACLRCTFPDLLAELRADLLARGADLLAQVDADAFEIGGVHGPEHASYSRTSRGAVNSI